MTSIKPNPDNRTPQSAESDHPAPSTKSSLNDPKTIRILQFAVVAMGVILVVGLLTVLGRILYLYFGTGSQGYSTHVTASSPGPATPLALPPGATIMSMSLSGDRLAIHFKAPSGSGIHILNTKSGAVERAITLVPDVPAN